MAASEVPATHIWQALIYTELWTTQISNWQLLTVMSPSVPEISITKPDKTVGRLRKIMVLNPQMMAHR